MAAVPKRHHVEGCRAEALSDQAERARGYHRVIVRLEDQHRGGDPRQSAGGGSEQPLQLVNRRQRRQGVIAVVGGGRRRTVLRYGDCGSLDVLQQAYDPDPPVVKAEAGIDDGDSRHGVTGCGEQGDGTAHREAGNVAFVGPGGQVQICRFEGAVPLPPSCPGKILPAGPVPGEQRNSDGEAAGGQVFGPGQDAEGAAGKAVRNRDSDPRVGSVSRVAESGGPWAVAAFCHETIVSLFRTILTRVGLHCSAAGPCERPGGRLPER
jgi:hypothetical protein